MLAIVRENARTTQISAAGQKAPPKVLGLYRRAFAEFRSRALWNISEFEHPTVEQVLAITRQLRTEGDMNARRLAEQIEEAARAHL
jgi:hypothetical protein